MPRFVRFDECPPGLFLWGGRLSLMTEYSETSASGERLRLAYGCASGEFFWGGTNTVAARNALKVQPISEAKLNAVATALRRDRDHHSVASA